jgi:hypothetical protein
MSDQPKLLKYLRATVAEKLDNHRRLRYLYRGFKQFLNPPQKNLGYLCDFDFLASPCPSKISGARLNLIIPTINQELAFGGINTSLQFWDSLASFYDNVRIIIMGDYSSSTILRYSHYQFVSLDEDVNASKQIVSLLKKYGNNLPVSKEDIFITTFWKTAYIAQRLTSWQSQEFNQPIKPIIYLIQDFEPSFYPWSSKYSLARSTYEYQNPMIAVFNTKTLQDYFHLQNYRFDHEYSFEPSLNKVLLDNLLKLKGTTKGRKIIIYGRPSTPRNAFSIIVESIRIWQKQFPEANKWEILSAGESHPDIPINDNLVIKSLGKLSLEDYAVTLANSAIGISLMVSPHPSYPPLEMAHSGMQVITNDFENKNLSLWHENITSVPFELFYPEYIASELVILCQKFIEDPGRGWLGKSRLDDYLSDSDPFPFVKDIHEILKTYDIFQD